jgi:lysophospholipase L1-like esterase/gamma-glutamylcyclotransferase (GGCT)/AIG2-like uncharacterized protein YtfP
MFNTGDYPALVEDPAGVAIEGELWDVGGECLQMLDSIEGVPGLFQRKRALMQDAAADVETYIYCQSTAGMPECGTVWPSADSQSSESAAPPPEPLFVVDSGAEQFERQRHDVDVICVGDSLTGWNNLGPAELWPFPTYPRFLQILCSPRQLRIADGGIAGEVSDNGPRHVQRYVDLFPRASLAVVGFGTNDLGSGWELAATSRRILDNLDVMVTALRERDIRPVLFNVPHVNETAFPPDIAQRAHEQRIYHNARLAEFCSRSQIPLADICHHLRDEHFGDELHPNGAGAQIIAREVFRVLVSTLRQS